MWSLFLGSDVRRFACTKNYQALSISAAEAFQSRETFAFAADSELGFLTKKAVCVVGHGSDFTCNTPYMREKNLSFSPHSLVSPSSSFHNYVKGSGSCNRHAVKLQMGLKGKGEKCLQSLIVIAANQQSAFSAVVMKTWPTQWAWCSCSCSSSSKNEAYIMDKYVLRVIISHFYQQLVSSWGCHFHSV